jgi:cation diffusion facilitator CzcD-associated flavoprotein CzcO
MSEVCIIGGGFSGIISAKVCKSYGLTPFILERSQDPGGVWKENNSDSVGMWDSMHVNNSKYALTYSDLPWDSQSEEYPSWREVPMYLSNYIAKHNLSQFFNYNCSVTKVKRHQANYIVKWKHLDVTVEKQFQYVVIAAGLFVKQNIPLKNLELFRGVSLHSSSYREPSIFVNKKVLCIGKNFSASDISTESAKTASETIQIFRQPTLMVTKYIKSVPYEFFIMKYDSIKSCKDLFPSLEHQHNMNKEILDLCGNPGEINPLWTIDEKEEKSMHTVYADDEYIKAVSQGRIKLVQGQAQEFYSDGVLLADGRKIPADVVIQATGYLRSYDFLSKEIQRIVKYDPSKPGLSMSLYRSVLHPELPRLCFVGNIRAFIPARYELQAEMGVRYMLGMLEVSAEMLLEGVGVEDYMRNNSKEEEYDPKSYLHDMLKTLNISIDPQLLQNELEFSNGMFLPQFIGISNPLQLKLCKDVIGEIKSRHPSFYYN